MKNKKVIYILSIGMVLLITIGKFGYDYLSNRYEENTIIDTGETTEKVKALDFTVYDENNNPVSLSDYQGKKNVVVNFWASWCPPCKKEMPYFEEAIKKYKDQDVEFLMVNLTDGMRETKEIAQQFLAEEGYDMDVVYDLDADAVRTYYLNAVPRTIFVDKDGNLTYDHSGIISQGILNNQIDRLLTNPN